MIPERRGILNKIQQAPTHTTMAAPADDEITDLATIRKPKLKPPAYDGNNATYEEWKCKFTAYMGLQDPFYPKMFKLAEAAARQVTEVHLRQAATTLKEAEAWVQLDQNLKYVLINVKKEQQPLSADNANMRLDSRCSGNST